jgi:cytidylate kinase|tara:strand:- start:6309 stop:6947 length:639 start_codon:yes stop_codon:yes gene_type:complete
MLPIVTIDGPSGSGKGTIAKTISSQLGWNYLDSGLIYRVFAFTHLKNIDFLHEFQNFTFVLNENLEQVIFKEENISSQLRGPKLTKLASILSKNLNVRKKLYKIQRSFLKKPGLVAEGRDMASVLFPESKIKIFLTAKLETRVERRANQLRNTGQKVNISELRNEIILRDKSDSERENSPLEISEDSVVIQNDSESVEDAAVKIINLINERY